MYIIIYTWALLHKTNFVITCKSENQMQVASMYIAQLQSFLVWLLCLDYSQLCLSQIHLDWRNSFDLQKCKWGEKQ